MKNYGYQTNEENGCQGYVEYITTLQRMPSEVYKTPNPTAHIALNNNNNKYKAVDQEFQDYYFHDHDHRHQHQHQHHNNKHHVHFAERERIINGGPNGEVVKEKDINMEADGFIKQKHKSFLHFCKLHIDRNPYAYPVQ